MTEHFDPYYRWLGIPPKHQPPNYYRLLGLESFESDPEAIRDAAAQRMAHVRTYQLGKHSELSQKILNELGAAKACLLDEEKRAQYDANLRRCLAAAAPKPVPPPAFPTAPTIPEAAASEKFDPYHEWLGVPASEQPPNHYRLLGIPAFEESPTVIENAADRQMMLLRTFQAGKHAAESQRLLNELAAARVCLLNPQKKAAYDQWLRQHLQPSSGQTDRSEADSLDPGLAAALETRRTSAPVIACADRGEEVTTQACGAHRCGGADRGRGRIGGDLVGDGTWQYAKRRGTHKG